MKTHVLACIALASLACTQTSQDVDLDGMTEERHEPHFPLLTGDHADATCEQCHLDSATFTDPGCTGCHEHSQALTDAAHLGIEKDYVYAPTACYACHPRGEAEGFDHEAKFPIASGTTHQDARCGSCHPDASARTRLDCVGCHTHEKTDPRHALVADYLWESRACFNCHPKADVAIPTNHQLEFPIGQGTPHAGIGCTTCHVDPANRKAIDCVSCHTHEETVTDANHSHVADYAYDSNACYACHPQGTVTPVADHTAFPIGAGEKHTGIACSSCHPVAGDRKQFSCVSCHDHEQTRTDANHAGVSGYEYASPSCYACHPTSTVDGVAHTYFPIDPGTSHGDASCSQCHQVPGDRKVVNCGSCHTATQMEPEHTEVGGYAYSQPLCIRCHADSQVNFVAQHLPFRIQRGADHHREACLSCHPAFRADKTWAADFTMPALSCGPCHSRKEMDDKHKGESGYNYSPPSCFSSGCHPDGRKP